MEMNVAKFQGWSNEDTMYANRGFIGVGLDREIENFIECDAVTKRGGIDYAGLAAIAKEEYESNLDRIALNYGRPADLSAVNWREIVESHFEEE